MDRVIHCKKLNKQLPGLEKPPFPGPLGKRIFDEISAEAWGMWKEMQIKILNEYRLNLADRKDYQTLMDQMELYLGLKDGNSLEVENADRGKN